ncbi:MAG: ribulose phosphate epimerase [Nannocystaceae bacterium]|nr:ribulose phosphate epimerase [bacterium]
MRLHAASLLVIVACGPAPADTAAESTGAPPGPIGTTSSGAHGESSSGGLTLGDPATSSSSSGDPLDGVPPGFLNPVDGGWGAIECSVWLEDCPPGEKCMPYANDGGSAWNATRCMPIAPDPAAPGEPCTVEGSGVSGIDTCELHSMCWAVDGRTLEGTCVGMCIGGWQAATCPGVDQSCRISADGTLALCLPICDPLAQNCEPGEGCYPSDSDFVCAPDSSEEGGSEFEPCEFTNDCEPGLVCANADLSPTCPPGSAACCTPYCSVSDPDCPSKTQCLPWFEEGEGPIGFQDVGICGVPS